MYDGRNIYTLRTFNANFPRIAGIFNIFSIIEPIVIQAKLPLSINFPHNTSHILPNGSRMF